MRLLVLGNPSRILIKDLCFNLKENIEGLSIDIISIPYKYNGDQQNKSFDRIFNLGGKRSFLSKIPYLKNIYFVSNIITLFKELPKYDFISIQFAYYFYSFVIKVIKNQTEKLIITFWGSDFNKLNFWQRASLKPMLREADIITTANAALKEKIIKRFDTEKEKFRLTRFGLTPLNNLKKINKIVTREEAKAKLGLSGKFVIAIGYNANKIQRHCKILDQLKKIKNKLPENYILLFPMTYGYGNYKKYTKKVRDQLIKLDFQFKIFDSFLTDEEVAYLRLSADIMIQLQKYDQLSGSMQEHLYAENIVITGSWLPYQTFKDLDIHFLELDNIPELNQRLSETLKNFKSEIEKTKFTPEKIWEMSSWEKTIGSWTDLLKNQTV